MFSDWNKLHQAGESTKVLGIPALGSGIAGTAQESSAGTAPFHQPSGAAARTDPLDMATPGIGADIGVAGHLEAHQSATAAPTGMSPVVTVVRFVPVRKQGIKSGGYKTG